jgi:hypothetical protein
MSISRQTSSGPEPPKAAIAKSRTSSPRLTVTWRMALAWFQAEISRMPRAASRGEAERGRQALDPAVGGVDVQRDLAAEQVGRDAAEHHVGVGDGRFGAALGVAERAGVGARRAGPTLSVPSGLIQAIDPPPAPTVTMSIIGIFDGNRPIDPSVVSVGSPPSTTDTSVEVPPPSQVRIRS